MVVHFFDSDLISIEKAFVRFYMYTCFKWATLTQRHRPDVKSISFYSKIISSILSQRHTVNEKRETKGSINPSIHPPQTTTHHNRDVILRDGYIKQYVFTKEMIGNELYKVLSNIFVHTADFWSKLDNIQ